MNLIKLMNQNWAIKHDAYIAISEIIKSHKEGPKIDLKALEAKMLSISPLPQTGNDPYQVIDGVAVIPVQGVLSKSPSLFERLIYGASSMTDIKSKINHAVNNAKIKGILLNIDSPGGTVDGAQELADYIYEARNSKNIIGYCDGLIASAAYWIGSAASEIYISSGTVEAGSIGVITTHYDLSEMDKAYGINVTEIFAGKYKAAGSDVKPLSPDDKDYIQSRIDYLYSVFVDAVARNRNESSETVLDQMADARIFIGQEAIDAGLVDGVSTIESVIDKLKSGNAAGAAGNIQNSIVTGPVKVGIQSASGADAVKQPITNQETKVELTIEILKKDHSALWAAIKKEITDENAQGEQIIRESAAAAERERIKGVAGQLLPGHENIINEMMFDGKSNAGDAAIKINAEQQKALKTAAVDFAGDLACGVDRVDTPDVTQTSANTKPLEEQEKETWDKNQNVRAEFGTFEAYLGYMKASKDGRVKIQGHKEAGK